MQYSKNPFRESLIKRELFGIGARFNIKENLKAGVGLMNEKEEDLLAVTDKYLRITSYVHNEFIIEENIILISPSFYNLELILLVTTKLL